MIASIFFMGPCLGLKSCQSSSKRHAKNENPGGR
jgi:hypothetical protein